MDDSFQAGFLESQAKKHQENYAQTREQLRQLREARSRERLFAQHVRRCQAIRRGVLVRRRTAQDLLLTLLHYFQQHSSDPHGSDTPAATSSPGESLEAADGFDIQSARELTWKGSLSQVIAQVAEYQKQERGQPVHSFLECARGLSEHDEEHVSFVTTTGAYKVAVNVVRPLVFALQLLPTAEWGENEPLIHRALAHLVATFDKTGVDNFCFLALGLPSLFHAQSRRIVEISLQILCSQRSANFIGGGKSNTLDSCQGYLAQLLLKLTDHRQWTCFQALLQDVPTQTGSMMGRRSNIQMFVEERRQDSRHIVLLSLAKLLHWLAESSRCYECVGDLLRDVAVYRTLSTHGPKPMNPVPFPPLRVRSKNDTAADLDVEMQLTTVVSLALRPISAGAMILGNMRSLPLDGEIESNEHEVIRVLNRASAKGAAACTCHMLTIPYLLGSRMQQWDISASGQPVGIMPLLPKQVVLALRSRRVTEAISRALGVPLTSLLGLCVHGSPHGSKIEHANQLLPLQNRANTITVGIGSGCQRPGGPEVRLPILDVRIWALSNFLQLCLPEYGSASSMVQSWEAGHFNCFLCAVHQQLQYCVEADTSLDPSHGSGGALTAKDLISPLPGHDPGVLSGVASSISEQIVAPLSSCSVLGGLSSRIFGGVQHSGQENSSAVRCSGPEIEEETYENAVYFAGTFAMLLSLCRAIDQVDSCATHELGEQQSLISKPAHGYVVKVTEQVGSKHNPVRNESICEVPQSDGPDGEEARASASSQGKTEPGLRNSKDLHLYYQLLNTLAFLPSLSTSLWSWLCLHFKLGSPTADSLETAIGTALLPDSLSDQDLVKRTPPKLLQGLQALDQRGGDVLRLFSRVYNHLLKVVDDREFYEKQQPLTLSQHRCMVNALNHLLYHKLLKSPLHSGPQPNTDKALSKQQLSQKDLADGVRALLTTLYERDCRRQFCPTVLWRAPATHRAPTSSSVDVRPRIASRASQDSDDSPIPAHHLGPIAREMPFVLDFEDRVKIFRALVKAEKRRYQDANGTKASVEMSVRRDFLVEDALAAVQRLGERLKGPLKVSFVSEAGTAEAGLDFGGLFKEFMTEVLTKAFQPQYAMFKQDPDGKLFPCVVHGPLMDEVLPMMESLGRLLGKALWEGLLVELSFAPFFFAQLTGHYCFLDDLPSYDAELYNNLMHLKYYEGDARDLALDFTIVEENFGAYATHYLRPRGDLIEVTNDNKLQYIYAVADFKLNQQLRPSIDAFRHGLSQLIRPSWLRLFSPMEVNQLLGGEFADIDIKDMMKYTKYSGGYGEGSRTVKLFWQVVSTLNPAEKTDLLRFVTSCSRPPLLGFCHLHPPFTIHKVRVNSRPLRRARNVVCLQATAPLWLVARCPAMRRSLHRSEVPMFSGCRLPRHAITC